MSTAETATVAGISFNAEFDTDSSAVEACCYAHAHAYLSDYEVRSDASLIQQVTSCTILGKCPRVLFVLADTPRILCRDTHVPITVGV